MDYLQRSLPPIHSVTCFQSLAKSIDASAVILETSVRACVCVQPMQTCSGQGATCHHRRTLYIHTANTLRATRKLRHAARSMRPTMRGIRPKSWPRSSTAHHARATCSTTGQGQTQHLHDNTLAALKHAERRGSMLRHACAVVQQPRPVTAPNVTQERMISHTALHPSRYGSRHAWSGMSVAMAPLMATFSPAVAAVALPVPVEKPVSLVFPKFFSMFGKVMNSFVVPTPAPGSRHVTCRFHHGIKPTPCVMHRTSGRMKLQATCLLNGAPPMLHDSPRNSVTRSSRDLDDAPSAAVMESPNAATTWQGPHKLPKIGQTREARWIKRKALRAPTQGCLTVMSPGLSLWMLVGVVGDGRPLHVNAVEGTYLTDEKLLPMFVRISTVTGIADASCMKAQTAAAKHRVAMLCEFGFSCSRGAYIKAGFELRERAFDTRTRVSVRRLGVRSLESEKGPFAPGRQRALSRGVPCGPARYEAVGLGAA